MLVCCRLGELGTADLPHSPFLWVLQPQPATVPHSCSNREAIVTQSCNDCGIAMQQAVYDDWLWSHAEALIRKSGSSAFSIDSHDGTFAFLSTLTILFGKSFVNWRAHTTCD